MNTRELLNITRGKKTQDIFSVNRKTDVRSTINIMRNLNEAIGNNGATNSDNNDEIEKIRNYFSDLMVNIEAQPIEIYDQGVFWAFNIDNQILVVYKVTPDDETSSFEIQYTDAFDKSNPENQDIVKRIETYYKQFYTYWRENILN